ncbi:acyltransferase family protein [Clostridium cellulovorans]|uniref:Acyltransferase 3 n=1 Tax=Clostridium cellulovorans (strain ATCC 35296 / DSM 3052 / OCM 3 / 743B) TaxID=573061 RepID=D9STJ0_CLOC7|nr:acyltransferase family protein [Clostridium cellulovorans]ADL52724.1 acyltransferase 3 [Clostridium cellulovorans 743B]
MNKATIRTQTEVRYNWVDALKFLGIFAIYLGHFEKAAGFSFKFVFTYHVPLFFFISGFFAISKKEITFLSFLKKKLNTLIIPYFVFSFISVLVITVRSNLTAKAVQENIIKVLFGIRNNLPAGSLWFIPCLFVVSITYHLLLKTIKNKYVVLFICLLLFVVYEKLLPKTPSWFFNIDSSARYIIYYAIGAIAFPIINNFKLNQLKHYQKFLFFTVSTLAIFYTALIYFQKYSIFDPFLISLGKISIFRLVIRALIIIYVNILLCNIFTKFRLCNNIGKNTLFLCGNEAIIKLLLPECLNLIGLKLNLATPLTTYIYTFILLIIAYYILIPFEKKLFQKILGIF